LKTFLREYAGKVPPSLKLRRGKPSYVKLRRGKPVQGCQIPDLRSWVSVFDPQPQLLEAEEHQKSTGEAGLNGQT
jgi:hypothetical protein